MATINALLDWIVAFRSTRKSVPRSSPLWAYKVTDLELNELQTILKQLASTTSIHRLVTLYESSYSEGFVLFAATWLQRNSAGRSKWPPLLASIGADDMDASDRYSLVSKGLRKWGLNVFSTDKSDRYLDTLACQGGFPRSDLLRLSSSNISNYFENVLRHYERYQHTELLEEVALEQLSILPITLQQDAFADLITRLIDCLLEWKSHYDLGVYKDAVKILDQQNPTWRSQLPFLVMDDEAQTLIDKLLRRTVHLIRREMSPVRVRRQLIPAGNDYRLTAELYIAKTIHPEDLERQIGKHQLPRVFLLSTLTADGNRFKTASFDLRSGPNGGWQVSSYNRTVNNSVAAGELRFSISSEGRHILEDTYYQGEALEQSAPWVFEISGSSLNYIGQGSVRSNKGQLVVVSRSTPVAANSIANVVPDGALIDTDLKVFKISGDVQVKALSGSYRIQCNAGENQEFKVRVESPGYTDVEAVLPVYLGPPVVSFSSGAASESIPVDQLYWFSKGSTSLVDLNDPSALGSGVIVWYKDGQLLWEKRCVILPAKFDVRLNAGDGKEFCLILRHARRPKIGVGEGFENWRETPPSCEPDEVRIAFVPKDAEARSIELSLLWGDNLGAECILKFPISFNIATITDRKGVPYRVMERGALTVNDLPNLQLVVRTELEISSVNLAASLLGKIRSDGKRTIVMSDSRLLEVSHIDGKSVIRGNEITEIVTGLFGLTDQLETLLSLKVWAGNELIHDDIPLIQRYKHDPVLVDNTSAFTLMPTPTLLSADDPVMFLSPIWDFESDPIELRPDDVTANLWRYTLPEAGSIEYGAWLIWASAELSVHPRLKHYAVPLSKKDPAQMGTIGAQLMSALGQSAADTPYIESLPPGSLPYRVKYLKPSDVDSMRELNKSIRNLGFNIYHLEWEYIDGVVKRINAIDPLALYSMTSMQRHPRTLAALLFRYPDRFQEMWELAPRLGMTWYSIDPKMWIEVIQQYFEGYQKKGELLKEIDETVYWNYVYRNFEGFQSKGPYFKYLLDLATDRPCFEPVAIWEDESLKAHGLDDQTVEVLFKAQVAALKDRHKGRLLDRVGTRNFTEKFLTTFSNLWPSSKLPTELNGFIRYTETGPSPYKTKQNAYTLTLAIPLKLGFCLSRYYYPPKRSRDKLLLSQVIARLDEFDRDWLQNALIIAHMACDILRLEKPDPVASEKEMDG